MLQLLRRYQKIIFIIITVTVILTFSFFGTYNAVAAAPKKEKDHKIGQSFDGSAIYAREIDDLVRFLRTDALDGPILEELSRVNLFNDGVIKKDIFQTGIGLMLLEHYSRVFQEELKSKFQKFCSFHPYCHPEAPFVSLESIWRQFVPEFFEHYKKFKATQGGVIDREKLETIIALYLDQCSFPPRSARQLLAYLQQQYRNVIPFDPYVQSGELALFNAKTVEDWFGIQFVEALAHFIHNASVYAQKQGYKVSKEEAKASLMKIAMDNAKMMNAGQMMTSADFAKYYGRGLQMLQMDEKAAVDLWQKVLLFRRLFNDVGHSVFLDKTLYEQFHQFASSGVQIDLYSMQPGLRLNTERDLYKFEFYLQAVAGKNKGSPLGLPTSFADEEDLMKRFPELIQKRFLIKVASIRRAEVERQVGLRYLMNWELEDENWLKLQKEFPSLEKLETKEKEARYEFLEAIDSQKRLDVDRYSITMILDQHPDFIRQALTAKALETKEIALSYKGTYSPLDGIKDPIRLMTLLQSTSGEGDKAVTAQEKLAFYSEDNDIFYKISLLDSVEKSEVMTFEEANERGILDRLLDHDLKIKYDSLKRAGSKLLVDDEGFEESRDLVGRVLFGANIDAMKKVLSKTSTLLNGKSDAELVRVCAKCRFYNHLEGEKGRLENGGDYIGPLMNSHNSLVLAKRAPFDDQFRVEKKNEEYIRKQEHPIFDPYVLKMEPNQWSQILVGADQSALFFQVKEKIIDEKAMQKGMQDGRCILSNEAKRHLMSRLLQEMDEKNVVIATSIGDS